MALAEEPLHPRYFDGGGVEQDPAALLGSVLTTGRRAAAQAGVPLAAVALANQGETVLAWDRATGRPLSAAVVWQDRRAETVCARRADAAGRVAELTGLDDVAWNSELLEVFGLAAEPLPAIVPNDAVVGTTRAFGAELPVTGLIVDQQAALLGEACIQAGDAKCTFGTGAFLLACTGTAPVRSTAGLTTSVAWRLRGQTSYCIDGQVYTAASAVRWITELGLITGAGQLDTTAAPASDGVLCVPALAGLAAPWWDSAAAASFSGMTLSSGRGQLVRALLEGIAAQVAGLTGLIAADLGAPLTRLRVDGGLTRSRVLMQAQADLAQIPVDVYPSAHATPFGAAACARLALDPAADLASLVAGWQPEHTYEPVWAADRAADHLARWYDATPGTLESRLVARGYHLLGDYAAQAGIPVERTGAILVAWTAEELRALPALKDKAERNGYHDCRTISAAEVYRQVPDLGPARLAAWPSPASRSPAPGPPTWPWPPTPSAAAPPCSASTPSPVPA
ncbi:MAG: FGGY-family carbohydrate kinase [Streptosporangiaceae bacterium]